VERGLRNVSERTKLYLSLAGVAITVLAFYVSNASSYPLVQRTIAPSSARARVAIDQIKRKESIQAGQPGFDALAGIIESRIADQNPQIPRSAIVLERLETTGGGITFGATSSRSVVGLKMFLRGQPQPLDWDLLELSDAVEDMWRARSLSWSVWLLWAGVIQTVWPMFVETKAKA
jgi:hypothetical protein